MRSRTLRGAGLSAAPTGTPGRSGPRTRRKTAGRPGGTFRKRGVGLCPRRNGVTGQPLLVGDGLEKGGAPAGAPPFSSPSPTSRGWPVTPFLRGHSPTPLFLNVPPGRPAVFLRVLGPLRPGVPVGAADRPAPLRVLDLKPLFSCKTSEHKLALSIRCKKPLSVSSDSGFFPAQGGAAQIG